MGANCRLLPTHQPPTATRARARAREREMKSLQEATSPSPQELTMDSTAEIITESPGELTPTPTQQSRSFFPQQQTQDIPAALNLSDQTRPDSEQKEVSQEPTPKPPQDTLTSTPAHRTEQNAPQQQEVPNTQTNREALRQNRRELYKTPEPQDPTLRRLRIVINTSNAELMRQDTTQQIQLLDVLMQRLTEEIAQLREFQRSSAARQARLLTPDERVQRLGKARRHLRGVRQEGNEMRRVANGLEGLVVAGLVVGLMIPVCMAGFYLIGE